MEKKTLEVKVISPKKEIFDGKALSVSSKNSSGNFDILPYHANFITLVKNEPIIIRVSPSRKIEIVPHLAILHCSENKVTIYVDPHLVISSF